MNFYLQLIIVLAVVGITLGIYYNLPKETTDKINYTLYQGPVPEGYDEQYFRQTGITKPLEVGE